MTLCLVGWLVVGLVVCLFVCIVVLMGCVWLFGCVCGRVRACLVA